jgi:two-component system copper resistance phosphate regulon response regulator CusR
MALLLTRALQEQECSVQTAFTGPDGLRLARSSVFDVITLDVMLPGMDGIEVARELRRYKVSSPILFLTARDSKVEVVRGLDVGGMTISQSLSRS